MPARAAFGTALRAELNVDLSNWKVSLSPSQINGFIAHIEQLIITNSANVIADCTADLASWPDLPKGHHT